MSVPPDEHPPAELELRRSAIVDRDWPNPWQRPFLDALSRIPNVSAAVRIVGINYSYAYEARSKDAEFAAAWEEAVNVACDLLEQIAHRRATSGEARRSTRTRRKREANSQGAMVLVEEETTEIEETHISDTLLQFLLKAHRPEKYRERVDHRHSGGDGGPVVIDEIYRRPTRERMLGLLELAHKHELPVIEGNGRRVEPVENGTEPE